MPKYALLLAFIAGTAGSAHADSEIVIATVTCREKGRVTPTFICIAKTENFCAS